MVVLHPAVRKMPGRAQKVVPAPKQAVALESSSIRHERWPLVTALSPICARHRATRPKEELATVSPIHEAEDEPGRQTYIRCHAALPSPETHQSPRNVRRMG